MHRIQLFEGARLIIKCQALTLLRLSVHACLFNSFPMSVHVRLANSRQHFLSVWTCFKSPICLSMPVWMGGWTSVAHLCLALKSITKHRQAHNVICECSFFLV